MDERHTRVPRVVLRNWTIEVIKLNLGPSIIRTLFLYPMTAAIQGVSPGDQSRIPPPPVWQIVPWLNRNDILGG